VRDKNQVAHLTRQIYPENWKSLFEAYLDARETTELFVAYLDATERPHSYFRLTWMLQRDHTVILGLFGCYRETTQLFEAYLDATERPHSYLRSIWMLQRDDTVTSSSTFAKKQTIWLDSRQIYFQQNSRHRIKSQFHILRVLKSANPKLRKVTIQEADSDLILAIVE
jgi:hypothetical protein